MSIEPIRISATGYASSSSRKRGKVWGELPTLWIVCFVALGFLACLGVSELMRRYDEIGALGALAVIILGPIAVFAGAAALPQAYRKLAALRREIRWWHWLILLLYISTLVFRKRDQDVSQSNPLDAWASLKENARRQRIQPPEPPLVRCAKRSSRIARPTPATSRASVTNR